ncbi:MAG: alpha/beta hydrolase [Thermoguttaceae bacterium]|nr:alpha/beta hydrolase [Thermoguttaceae bacterium]
MKTKQWSRLLFAVCLLLCLAAPSARCEDSAIAQPDANYRFVEYPLERAGVALHLTRIDAKDVEPEKDILLVHGVTYSSHEFDVNYKDYSLARRLAREGYSVWLLDIAGFGGSQPVEDGFAPDTDYAAEDINAAVERIVDATGRDKIDVLGWSWGTVTVGRFAISRPEHIDKVVLYAPILCGVGEIEVSEPFHRNTWEHSVEDFQRREDGSFDEEITDPVVREFWASSCWRRDGDSSPNGGRRDLCVDPSVKLIDLSKLSRPTLVICGTRDPYLNYELVDRCLDLLPEGSRLEKIEGGAHAVFVEKPHYRDFQERALRFLAPKADNISPPRPR